ncbi:flagellar hook-length control protein [Burkholderia ubonensis]|uniref:flagellar hook-length control protein FliK n=1 Tax=Burkholderia ubonensis TaxID=101571 RepID=UPI00075CEF7D|nr:flagellar hook-length control protein FliK [Burkholderia ubonensis]KVM14095.1 flagellar hook-length control protein [Burkholderia ubonensis]KVM20206.1 flagellar hook-length control protein [Burkholderia ubonensis]KVM41360.1 flagellar hook-length control protein [Burkholderia ubonensis]
MPSLSLLGALIDTAGSALKAGRKAAAADASAPANAADGASSPLPFAQTLQQSVASQRTSSAQADASSTPTAPSTSSGAPSTVAGNAKPSGSSDDKTRDDATAAVNPDAAALAAAAAVQAQLQARPDGTPAAADAPSTDPLSRAGDAASAALAAAAHATKGDAQAAAATDESATSRDVLHAALAKLTGDANAAATPSTGAATGAATGTAAQPALSTAAAVPATPKAPTFDKTLTDAKGALASQQGQAQPSPTQPVQADAVKPDAAHALAATQDAAAPAGAALAAATAAAQANAPVAAAANGIAAANAHVLAPHVGTADWTDALSQKVVFLSNAHQQSAELTLNPPDLGPLQVVLRVADNHAHALFVSQHPQVRDAVEAALPKLRDAMEAGGLGLGSATVSDGGFASQQQNPQQSFAGGQAARRGGAPSGADATLDAAQPAATVATASRAGLVDTFA